MHAGADRRRRQQGRKELLAIEDGFRESAQSWRELLLRLRDENGLELDPELATGDGALGFWQALHEVWPKTKPATMLGAQDCECAQQAASHPCRARPSRTCTRSTRPRTVRRLSRRFDRFARQVRHQIRQGRRPALARIARALLTFYDFPAEHWKHIRTTNPIESTFATVRLRTSKTKGCLSRQTALAMVFKLAKSAERHWRRLDGSQRLAQVIDGVRFRDGEPVQATEEQAAA